MFFVAFVFVFNVCWVDMLLWFSFLCFVGFQLFLLLFFLAMVLGFLMCMLFGLLSISVFLRLVCFF